MHTARKWYSKRSGDNGSDVVGSSSNISCTLYSCSCGRGEILQAINPTLMTRDNTPHVGRREDRCHQPGTTVKQSQHTYEVRSICKPTRQNLPFRSGLVHFLIRCIESFENFCRGTINSSLTSDMVGSAEAPPAVGYLLFTVQCTGWVGVGVLASRSYGTWAYVFLR